LQSSVVNNYIENQKKREKIKSIWEKEQAYLIAKFSKKNTDEARDKEHKLIYFDDEIKQSLIIDYLDRCKLRHLNFYCQWRCHYIETLDQIKGLLRICLIYSELTWDGSFTIKLKECIIYDSRGSEC
jgi:hypothetical protein